MNCIGNEFKEDKIIDYNALYYSRYNYNRDLVY